jgi:hypothetical protein
MTPMVDMAEIRVCEHLCGSVHTLCFFSGKDNDSIDPSGMVCQTERSIEF